MRALIAAIGMAAMISVAASESNYPREVEAVLNQARAGCKDAGGSAVTFGPETVKKLALSGHGARDYVVDLQYAACDGAASLYCGTGGCDVLILVARPDGSLVTVFDNHAHNYEILPGRGARKIRFQIHGSFCGKHGSELCVKTHRITAKPFDFKKPE